MIRTSSTRSLRARGAGVPKLRIARQTWGRRCRRRFASGSPSAESADRAIHGVIAATTDAEFGSRADRLTYLVSRLGQYLGDGWIDLNGRRGVLPPGHRCAARRTRDQSTKVQPVRSSTIVVPLNRDRPGVPRQGVRERRRWSIRPTSLALSVPAGAPGKKHDRRIVLEPWQEQIASDRSSRDSFGSRADPERRCGERSIECPWRQRYIRYEYPRYQFTNVSDDIRDTVHDACDVVGVDCDGR